MTKNVISVNNYNLIVTQLKMSQILDLVLIKLQLITENDVCMLHWGKNMLLDVYDNVRYLKCTNKFERICNILNYIANKRNQNTYYDYDYIIKHYNFRRDKHNTLQTKVTYKIINNYNKKLEQLID